MVRGKPSNQSALQVDFTPLSLRYWMNKMDVGRGWCPVKQCSATTTTMRDEEWCPIVGESGPDPRNGMKGKRLVQSDSTVLQACVLGLPLQGWKFDSESSVSHEN